MRTSRNGLADMTARKARRRPQPAVVDSRAVLDDMIAEEGREGLRAAIIAAAVALGYLVHHCYDSRLCGPHAGLPDLILVGHGRIIFVELKKQRGRKSFGQYQWENALVAAGGECYTWRPSDWSSGSVERILAPAA